MINYGFFNSVNGDRLYDANDMSNYFDGLISNGIYKNINGAFQVVPGENMTLQVLDGRAMINCKWVTSDTFENVTIAPADVNYDRYDAVVLRLDEDKRQIVLTTVEGTPSSNPAYPSLADADLCLAYVKVLAGTTSIVMDNIIDKRAWIKGIISSSGRLKKLQRSLTVTSATTTINIGIAEFDSETDILEVYRSGIYLVEGADYTINGSSIEMTESINSGTLVFVIHKLTV